MMGHSKRSDREIAKKLYISQPTVTRTRRWLETNGFINEYTLIPNFSKIGLELVAFTFVKLRAGNLETHQEVRNRDKPFLDENPNVVMALHGEGMGCNGVLVSLHKNFAEFTSFMRDLKTEMIDSEIAGSFLASLTNMHQYRDLTFKHLKEYMYKEKPKQ
jgi:DNA-binding Lrp family transcriptional regulator